MGFSVCYPVQCRGLPNLDATMAVVAPSAGGTNLPVLGSEHESG